MQLITSIRMTDELANIIRRTAHKCGISVADVLRTVAVGIRNNRPRYAAVVTSEKLKVTTSAGDVVLGGFGGITIPEMYTAATLRREIFFRCMEELDRPERPRRKAIPAAVEGIDYNVPDTLAAAKLMEAERA